MVKTVTRINSEIVCFLGEENHGIFSAYTGLLYDEPFAESIVWVQFDENNNITAVAATGKKSGCVIFTSENADLKELSFVISQKITSPNTLPLKQIDKKYLMRIKLQEVTGNKGINYKDFYKIGELNGATDTEYYDRLERQMFLNLKGRCEGALIVENGVEVSGGYISLCKDFSIITDIFTKEDYRKMGFGRMAVNNLLKCSVTKNVYLTSKEHNTEFYKKLGFSIVKEIYEYEIKEF